MSAELSLSLERRLYEAGKIVPAAEFQDTLQGELFAHIGEKNELWFEQQCALFENIPHFSAVRTEVWNKLLEDTEVSNQIITWQFWKKFFRHPLFWKIFGVGTVFVLSISLLWGKVLGRAAESASPISTVSPVGAVMLDDQAISTANTRLTGENILSTTDGTAEISFFDGTRITLDKNTRLSIEKNLPDPSFPDTGKIELSLDQGHLWLSTFSEPKENSGVTVKSGDLVITPLPGTIDLSRRGNRLIIQVWQRSIQVSDTGQGQSNIFIAGSKISFSTRVSYTEDPITPGERNDEWTEQMLERDERYQQEQLQKILAAYADATGVLPNSRWYPLKDWYERVAFTTTNSTDALELATTRFSEAILLGAQGEKLLAQKTLAQGVQILRTLLAQEPDTEPFILHFFATLKKNFLVNTLDPALSDTRTAILAAEAEIFQNSPVFLARHILEYLWDIQDILLAHKGLLPRERLVEYSAVKELLPNAFSTDPGEKRLLLQVKIQELKLLNYLFAQVFADEILRQDEQKVITEALAISEQKEDVSALSWDANKFAPTENPIFLWREKINAVESIEERRVELKKLLDTLPGIPRDLPFLDELRAELSTRFRDLITAKIIAILEAEERKTIL